MNMAKKKAEDNIGISDDEVMGTKNQRIRDMNLTDEQKASLIYEEIKRIVKTNESVEGVRTTTSIKYPVDGIGAVTVTAIFDLDYRVAQRAWDYYKDNADKPTVKGFIDGLSTIIGIKEYHRRVVDLTLN